MNGLDANLIIANAPDPVFVSDLQGKILVANEAVSALLGFRKDEVLEQSLSRFISVEETREFMAALREVVARGVTRNARLNPRSASGEIIPTTLNASALPDPDGTVIGAIGILRDMRAYEMVVRALEESRRKLDDAKGILLATNLDPYLGPVSADPDRLQQVVWNLLTNAIKFTPSGGRVDIRLERADSLARITVSDTGKGIRSDLLPFVFDRFRQEETSIGRRHGGLGLGLAIVRHIVELHGGVARAESSGENRGAPFTVDLPLPAPRVGALEPEPARPPLDRETVRPAVLKGLRVLVVDDDADARELMRIVLRSSGAEVMSAASAEEAFEQVEQWHPDILVSDIGLPDVDGYALIQKLRTLEAERGWSIPALAVTAYARVEDRTRALSSGFQMHVAKPLEPADLVAAITSLLGKDRGATTVGT